MPGVRPGALLGHSPGLWTPPKALAGGAPFTPASLPNLSGWWDFSTQAGADGTAIPSVSDLSGNGRTLSQATGSLQPLVKATVNGINGLKVGLFDGVDDVMLSANFASPTAGASIFAVIQLGTTSGPGMLACHSAAATWVTPFARAALRLNNTGPPAKWEGWVEDGNVSPGNYATSTAAVVMTAQARGLVYDQSTITHYKDGAADGANARSGLLTSSNLPFYLCGHQGTVEVLSTKVGEVVYCAAGLAAGDISSLSTYFRNKWGTP